MKFLEFPQIKSYKKLNQQLDEWLDLYYRFGDEMVPAPVQTNFLRILPDSLRREVLRRSPLISCT